MRLFHIHVDAAWVSQKFEVLLTSELGFYRTDFVGADGGKTEPFNHLTFKTANSKQFRETFRRVVTYAQGHKAMVGYVEGEVISIDRDFSHFPFKSEIPAPFKIETAPLPPKTFRESEFHLTLCPERSDPRLLKRLTDMGLMMIYIPKAWGIALVYTAQGERKLIRSLVASLSNFLEHAGGAVMCSLKEERVAKWWATNDAVKFPPVVQSVQWLSEQENL